MLHWKILWTFCLAIVAKIKLFLLFFWGGEKCVILKKSAISSFSWLKGHLEQGDVVLKVIKGFINHVCKNDEIANA